jgi:glycine/D-amino acid oxidase-like deaminating enzyme
LSAALSARELHPEADILVLERGPVPHGASTRNAGFACIGSVTELADDLHKQSFEEVFDLVKQRKDGLDILCSRLGKELIKYEQLGGFEVFTKEEEFEEALKHLRDFNRAMAEITGLQETYQVSPLKMNEELGMKLKLPMICNRFEAQINTGRMMDGLLSLCLKSGIRILNSTRVLSFEEVNDEVILETEPFGMLKASRMLVCTNGFASELIPEAGVRPARAQVLITSAIEGLKLRGSFHFDKGYSYFRNIDGRVLLGGGRNLDFLKEETTEMEVSARLQDYLEGLLSEIILPDRSFTIEQRWAGIMGVGDEKKPIIKMIGRRSACSVRMGGMGVALGSAAGAGGSKLIMQA